MAESDLALNAAALAEARALHEAAALRGDAAMAQRFAEMMRVLSADLPLNEHSEELGNGLRVLKTQRWEEARDVLSSLDRSRLPLVERPGVLAILAHLNAMAGDRKRSTELILGALKEVEAIGDYPKEKLLFLQGTHVLALLLDGKADEVIGFLRPLMAIDSTNRLRAGHAYFLATAYLALGREDDARPLFEITAAGEPNPFAGRAKQALVGLEKTNELGDDPASALAAAYKAAYERGDLEEAEELSTMMRQLAEDQEGEKAG